MFSLSNPGIAKRLYAINSPPHAHAVYFGPLVGGGYATSMKRFRLLDPAYCEIGDFGFRIK